MKRFLFLFLAILFYISPVYAKNNILILGDSLSAGHGFDPQKSWPMLLAQKLQMKVKNKSYQVINLSISGSTTSNGLSELPQALKKYQPTITILELGANDGLRGLDIDLIKNNLQQLISLSQKHSKVLLLSVRLPPNYGPIYNQKFNAVFKDLARQNNIAFVPLFLSGIDDKPSLMQSDGLHPNVQAQSIILQNIWPTLEKLLT